MSEMIKTYEDGLNEAFEAFKKIMWDYGTNIIFDIFPDVGSRAIIFKKYSPQEIVKRIEEYETEKNKPKMGDVVRIKNGDYTKLCIFLYENDDLFWVLSNDTEAPQQLYKKCGWTIRKTERTINIQGMLDFIAIKGE